MNAGYWDGGYELWPQAVPYGSTETYEQTVPWLAETCAVIEDWGAGPCWGRRWVPETVAYRPIDWSAVAVAKWGGQVADLAGYRSDADGILIRHVLEHNHAWAAILDNALASFRKRMCLVTFIPFSAASHMQAPDSPGLDWSFARADLTAPMGELLVTDYGVASDTAFGREHVFKLER